jgi:hypothetical protein
MREYLFGLPKAIMRVFGLSRRESAANHGLPRSSSLPGGFDPLQALIEAQRELIEAVAPRVLDDAAKARVAQIRRRMLAEAKKVSRDPALMNRAEQLGMLNQIKSLVREADRRPR